ncbi:hypothetical protein [Nonlabens dokdonensis]|uniref:hypothetical protein n=1 Tax=Nonlabens dokdonensis TaxID=328515 RepID=UPI0026ED5FF7|nr:hypothetical protein [Nonlabens dokdonensis]
MADNTQLEKDMIARFNKLVNIQNAASIYGLPKLYINNLRHRSSSFAKKLEFLFKVDHLRLKDDWDE